MSMELQVLASDWLIAKDAEHQAVANRRAIEDRISELLRIDAAADGQSTHKTEAYAVKVTTRLNRKVDSELIQEVAAEHGLSHLLYSVCRWKPELDMKVWKSLEPQAQAVLAKAITTTAGRPSFSIAINQE